MSNQFNGTSEIEVSTPTGRSKQRPQRLRRNPEELEEDLIARRIMRAAELSRPGYEVAYDPDQGVYRVTAEDCSSRVKKGRKRTQSSFEQSTGRSGDDQLRFDSSSRKLNFTPGEPLSEASVSPTHPAKRTAYGRDYSKGDNEHFVAGRSHARLLISGGTWPSYSGPKIAQEGKRAYRAHIDELFGFLGVQFDARQLEFIRGIGFEYCAQLAAIEDQTSADRRWTTFKSGLKSGNYTMAFSCISSIHYRIQELLKEAADTESE